VFLAFVVLLNIFAWMFLKALFLEPLEDPAWAIFGHVGYSEGEARDFQ